MNRVHSAASGSIPVEGRSYVRDELDRLMAAVDHRRSSGSTDHMPERTTAAITDLAARLALINAQRLDDLTARIKDTTHDR